MSSVEQFLLHNLLPAVVAGMVVWTLVVAGIRLLRIEHGSLRFCLLGLPPLKSTLVLLGVGLALPWPEEVFAAWQARAVPFRSVLPYFLIVAGCLMALRSVLGDRARRTLLQRARPAVEASPRLKRALDRVMTAFDEKGSCDCGPRCRPRPPRPELVVDEGELDSPTAITAGRPTIVFPAGLVGHLDDAELEAALAHEIAHLQLRRSRFCTSATIRNLAAVNPMAALMSSQLRREEEKACDDLAVDVLESPEVYPGMLLKSYRFATERRGPVGSLLAATSGLLGEGSLLAERIERLTATETSADRRGRQRLAFLVVAATIWALFLTG